MIGAVAVMSFFGWWTSNIAQDKGRDRVIWFIVGFFLLPIGVLLAYKATEVHEELTGEEVACPFCGFLVKPGKYTCPRCATSLSVSRDRRHSPQTAVISRDVLIGDTVAFRRGEIVNVENVDPDPERPDYRFVVLSRTLNRRFRLSANDLFGTPGGFDRK